MKPDGPTGIARPTSSGWGLAEWERYEKRPGQPQKHIAGSQQFYERGGLEVDDSKPKLYGRVGYAHGLTINLGNFQFDRRDVWTDMPCVASPAGRESMHAANKAWVDEKLAEELKEVEAGD